MKTFLSMRTAAALVLALFFLEAIPCVQARDCGGRNRGGHGHRGHGRCGNRGRGERNGHGKHARDRGSGEKTMRNGPDAGKTSGGPDFTYRGWSHAPLEFLPEKKSENGVSHP